MNNLISANPTTQILISLVSGYFDKESKSEDFFVGGGGGGGGRGVEEEEKGISDRKNRYSLTFLCSCSI